LKIKALDNSKTGIQNKLDDLMKSKEQALINAPILKEKLKVLQNLKTTKSTHSDKINQLNKSIKSLGITGLRQIGTNSKGRRIDEEKQLEKSQSDLKKIESDQLAEEYESNNLPMIQKHLQNFLNIFE